MAQPCATCEHPQVREINHRIRENRPLTDISRWLKELDTPITRQALARHAQKHLGIEPTKGRRPVSGDFLEAVRDRVHERMAEGEIEPSMRDGIAAQKQLDARTAKFREQDLMLKIALALTGNTEFEGEVRELPPERAALEAEYRQLLAPGD